MVDQKVNINRMFLEPKWMESKHGITLKGIEFFALVFNGGFWKYAKESVVVIESLVKILKNLKRFQCST